MNIDELYEQALYQEYLYSICQHQCDGMTNCKIIEYSKCRVGI